MTLRESEAMLAFRPPPLAMLRLWRGEPTEVIRDSFEQLDKRGLTKAYADVPGLCKAASLKEIGAQEFSLNPGRYVGATAREAEAEDFSEKLEELQEEFEKLERNPIILYRPGNHRT